MGGIPFRVDPKWEGRLKHLWQSCFPNKWFPSCCLHSYEPETTLLTEMLVKIDWKEPLFDIRALLCHRMYLINHTHLIFHHLCHFHLLLLERWSQWPWRWNQTQHGSVPASHSQCVCHHNWLSAYHQKIWWKDLWKGGKLHQSSTCLSWLNHKFIICMYLWNGVPLSNYNLNPCSADKINPL